MGNVHAAESVPSSAKDVNNNLPGLMKRTCQRMSLKRDKLSSNSPSSKLHQKSHKNRIVMKAMPRCSSFEDLSIILPSMDNDPTYLLWKKSFECPRAKSESVKQSHLKRMKRRVHNMTSAISGHITPKGFPSYINLRPFRKVLPPQSCSKQNQYTKKKPLDLPKQDNSPFADRKIPLMHSNCVNSLAQNKNISKYPLTSMAVNNNNIFTKSKSNSKISTEPKYTLTPLNLLSKMPQSKQALVIEKLFRDIQNLESYYDSKMDSFVF